MDRKNIRIDLQSGLNFKIPNICIQKITMPNVVIDRAQKRLIYRKV